MMAGAYRTNANPDAQSYDVKTHEVDLQRVEARGELQSGESFALTFEGKAPAADEDGVVTWGHRYRLLHPSNYCKTALEVYHEFLKNVVDQGFMTITMADGKLATFPWHRVDSLRVTLSERKVVLRCRKIREAP